MSDWNNMDSWEVVLPPSRPTPPELERIEKYLSGLSRKKPIAVLGSTPEFRELLYRLGFEKRFVFDRSMDFYLRMGKLIPEQVQIGEKMVLGEWYDTLPEYKGQFAIVLSDLTMGNVPYERRKEFYSKIYDVLNPAGTFIDKVLAFDFDVPTIENLFKIYEKKPINLRTVNDFSSEVLFCSELVVREQMVDSTKLYDYIDNGNFSDKIKFFSRKARMITPEGFVWYYGKKWSELVEDYSSLYCRQEIYSEEDRESPYYRRTKQFFNIK
ncbi:MAG: hypothetical protein LUG99_10865 [Lachnospiraceae bacterium]|nr:hypothetical protein [Lachnospiraceae bacterium]